MRHKTKWTEQEAQTLKEHLVTGATYAEIASLLDRKTNGIKAKAKKLGLKRNKQHIKGWSAGILNRVMKPRKIPESAYKSFAVAKNLLDIREGECRYPIEGSKLFCAARCRDIYCPEHRRICFAAAVPHGILRA